MADEEIQLYLVRHGIAAERGDAWPDDAKRPLTSRGIARMRREAAALARIDVAFDVVLTSPLARAKQTADVLAEHMPSKPGVVVVKSLAPGGRYHDLVEDLSRQHKRRIALVGHEPDMSTLAAKLLGMRGGIDFKKGAICRIDFDALPPTGPGYLRWLATPKMLRTAAKRVGRARTGR
jgi:phosphohistidine phosphatase